MTTELDTRADRTFEKILEAIASIGLKTEQILEKTEGLLERVEKLEQLEQGLTDSAQR